MSKYKNLTQADAVIEYIKENGSITRLEALTELGIFELAARLCELRERGYKFTKEPYRGVSARGRVFTCKIYRLADCS